VCLANSKLGLIFEVSGGGHSQIAVFEKFIVASQSRVVNENGNKPTTALS
jgi:hypothetical protein